MKKILEILNRLVSVGIKKQYEPWEISATRKVNLLTLVGFFNVVIALIVYWILDYYDYYVELLFVIIVAPFVFVINKYKNYIWALYLFYFIGFGLFTPLILKMGLDSFLIFLYFPMLINLILVTSRVEMLKHMFILLFLHLIVIFITIIGVKYNWMHRAVDAHVLKNLQVISIIFTFSTTIGFLISVSMESIKQERQLKSLVKEKDVLLAEVFHRVKNNMNIVTSLLNLKKDSSDSPIVKSALEECRNRVFSMALVHQNIYEAESLTDLDLKEYIHDLMDELINSLALNENIEVSIQSDEITLSLNHAVPIGLILNELITNSFKYGQLPNKKLRIEIKAVKEGEFAIIMVKDNGPGINLAKPKNTKALGMDLINSLVNQIDGYSTIGYENGFVFTLKFKV